MSVKFNFVYLEPDAASCDNPQRKKVGFILEIGTIVLRVELKRRMVASERVRVGDGKLRVTLGWDGYPTITDGRGILPRRAEMIIHGHYYPNGIGSWPVDPDTGEKLEIENFK